jgi:hypothetical protein
MHGLKRAAARIAEDQAIKRDYEALKAKLG